MTFQIAKDNSLDRSLFARLSEAISNSCSAVSKYSLTTQYRMPRAICEFPNRYFYNNSLETDVKPNNIGLHEYNVFSLHFQQSNVDNAQFYNDGEAKFIKSLLKVLVVHADTKTNKYGVITPYTMQKSKIIAEIRYIPF